MKRQGVRKLVFRLSYQPQRRILMTVLAASLGLTPGLSVPVRSGEPAIAPAIQPIAQSFSAQALLQQGVERYEAEQFAAAAETWQQAFAQFQAQGDRVNQALVLSHLSLAYQQLGQWTEAERAIAASISQLQADTQPPPAILAKALNTQGRLQWFQGQPEAALETWQQATALYEQAGDSIGVVMGLINQTQALQALGFSVQAEERLTTVYQMLQRQSDPALKATGLRSLGVALRRVGKLQESQETLEESQAAIATLDQSMAHSATLLELGNTARALANRAIAIGQTDAAQIRTQEANTYYQQAATLAASSTLRLQAHLNQFSLQVETEQLSAVTLLPTITSELAHLPLSRTRIYAQLNFARSLTKFQHSAPSTQHSTLTQLLADALQQARSLKDPIAESYALGQLGELYEQTGQWSEAQNLTQQALLKAEGAQATDVRYRWEWQLGRLREKQGDKTGAITAYKAAVESLESIRSDLLRISPEVQFSFRDDVEPVYRGLVKLLLTSEGGAEPSQENLKQAIYHIDALQLTELENFLGCDLTQTVAISEVEVDPTAAKVYPILLEDRIAVIVELPNQPLAYDEILKPRQEVEATLQQLRQDLSEPDRTPDAIAGLQAVYQWLIAPFRTALDQNSQIQTLVFVLDGELRNIPMAALHDGQQYLIAQYAVALSPRLELFQPNPRPQDLDVLLGGIGEPQTIRNRTFPEIENLSPELEGIRQLVNADQPLLNAEFTEANLEQRLKADRFSVIHFKTHGVFSSEPEETFIVAYQDLITSGDLGRLIQASRADAVSPVELLVLSACSTAEGDDRAVLGLAGMAVQAGARSVISTLWEAQDLPNTQLMIRFYQELENPATSRAQALRTAQLALLEQGYRTPHVWATYVLVGNWL